MLVFIFQDNREGVLEKDYISRILSNWYFRYRDFIIENFIYFLEGVLRKLRVWNIFRAKSVQINSFRGEWRSFFQTWNEISSFRWRQIILRLNYFRHFRWQKLRIVGSIIAYFKRKFKRSWEKKDRDINISLPASPTIQIQRSQSILKILSPPPTRSP